MAERQKDKALRKGWTTGACATAAACAAYEAMVSTRFPDPVEIVLPKGQTVAFSLNRQGQDENGFWASVIKDAGDDPDITHGAEIRVHVHRAFSQGVTFKNGPGVGVVTKPGLPLAVGEPAINPVPRQMIEQNLQRIGQRLEDPCHVVVTVSIKNGEELALKTMNPRLGIQGGLSVLGTSGIVVPYSCASWIHSIHRGIDVARAAGLSHLAGATGSTSENTVQHFYALPETALIDMGDFAGAVLKYIRNHPVDRLTLSGGFAKFCKLACGEMDLHSSRSRIDFAQLGRWMSEVGATDALVAKTRSANSALEVLELSQQADLPLGDLVCLRAREFARTVLNGTSEVDVMAINRKGDIVGHAHP